jgi:predicted nucleic acid-binding protein
LTVTLLDTGPLVAFIKRDDHHHPWAIATLARLKPPLRTCDAVLAETLYLLRGSRGGADVVFELLGRGVIESGFDTQGEGGPLRTLIAKYGARIMDFADACLVRMSELHRQSQVLTVDTQFRDVYRRNRRQVIPTLLPPGR